MRPLSSKHIQCLSKHPTEEDASGILVRNLLALRVRRLMMRYSCLLYA